MSERRSFNGRPLIVIAIGVALLAIDCLVPAAAESELNWCSGLAVGVYVGQLNLLAIYVVLGPGTAVIRLPLSLLLGLLVLTALWLGTGLIDTDSERMLVFASLLVGGFVVLPFPLWVSARALGWRLRGRNATTATDSRPLQFQVKHLLGATFLCAAAMGLGRLLWPDDVEVLIPANVAAQLAVFLLTWIVGNLLITLLAMRVAFAPMRWLAVCVLGCWLYCAAITAVEMGVLALLRGGRVAYSYGDLYKAYCAMNLSQSMVVSGVLVVLRALGCTLQRRARGRKVGLPVGEALHVGGDPLADPCDGASTTRHNGL